MCRKLSAASAIYRDLSHAKSELGHCEIQFRTARRAPPSVRQSRFLNRQLGADTDRLHPDAHDRAAIALKGTVGIGASGDQLPTQGEERRPALGDDVAAPRRNAARLRRSSGCRFCGAGWKRGAPGRG